MLPQQKAGLLYGLGAYFAWGFAPLYWKLLLDVPTPEILAHRVAWSLVFVGALLLYRGRLREVLGVVAHGGRARWSLLASATLIGGNWGLYIWAVNAGYVIEASLGYFINPLVNVLIGRVVLREPLSRIQLGAVVLATIGVVSMALGAHGVPWISLALAFSFAIYGLIRKTITVDSLAGLGVESLLLFPVAMGYLAYLASTDALAFGHVRLGADLLLVGTGVVTALPLLWFAHAARRLAYSTVGLLQYIAPSCQFLLAVFLFKEPFGLRQLASFACIWGALALYTLELARQSRKASRALRQNPLAPPETPGIN